MGKHSVWWSVLAVVFAVMAGGPAAYGEPDETIVLRPDDWEVPLVAGDPGLQRPLDLFEGDPTGLVPKKPFVQRYSLDQDQWEVWLCGAGIGTTMNDAIAALEDATVGYFDAVSGGRYEPVFTAGSTSADSSCLDALRDGSLATVGNPEGVVVIDDVTSGGYASPGLMCLDSDPDCPSIGSTFPDSRRYAVIGEGSLLGSPSVTVHEFGHALHWPHSNAGVGDEYDNWIDLMSGNRTTGGWTEPQPYGTLSYNRLQSGWVDDDDVVVADGTAETIHLKRFDVSGTQVLAVPTDEVGRFFVLGARLTTTFDPIPAAWEGVEVYLVDYYCDDSNFGGGICPGMWRSHTQQPPSPGGVGHVLQVGESVELSGLVVEVTAENATGFTVTVDPGTEPPPPPPPPPPPVPIDPFTDDDGSVFEADIEWLAGSGITRGCNPPVNDLFCPNHRVTRGQMAAFLVRALDLTVRLDDPFTDDDGSVFEADIEKLAASGITRGCNPPANDRFCPDDPVTRAQMAAFLVRAFGYSADGGGNLFGDDDGSVFERDIDRLATAGVTRGCNPPANDRYCPDQVVTRGQMAAFLHRAMS